MQGIARPPLERAAAQAAIVFEAADDGFDGLPLLGPDPLPPDQGSSLAAGVHAVNAPTSAAQIDDGTAGPDVGEDERLRQLLIPGLAVVRVASKASGSRLQRFSGSNGDADSHPEFIRFARQARDFAFIGLARLPAAAAAWQYPLLPRSSRQATGAARSPADAAPSPNLLRRCATVACLIVVRIVSIFPLIHGRLRRAHL